MIRLIILTLLLIMPFTAQAQAAERIVSIGGALTEIIYALDAQDHLVGRDITSTFPAEANALPNVGYKRALSAEGVLSLSPDLVILTNDAGPPNILAQIKSTKVDILTLKEARTIEDIYHNIEMIAEKLNRANQGAKLIAELKNQQTELQTMQKSDKRVMFVMQHGGGAPMVAGQETAADSMIALSGATNVVNEYEGYRPLTPEAAVALKPDVILIAKQSPDTPSMIKGLLDAPGIGLTPAGKNENIIEMDSLLLLGFGPRTLDAAKQLKEAYQTL